MAVANREHPLPVLRINVGLNHTGNPRCDRARDDFLLAALEGLVDYVGVSVNVLHTECKFTQN